MSIRIELIDEPKLQFNRGFEHEDAKTGLTEYGPYGRSVTGLHPTAIKLGFVGTRETISDAKGWIEACGRPIESEKIAIVADKRRLEAGSLVADQFYQSERYTRREKVLNPDFPGFNLDSPWSTAFQVNDRWDRMVTTRELDQILGIDDKAHRIATLVDLFDGQIETLATTSPRPDIIILALTPQIVEQAHAVRLSRHLYLNFRRAIKARTMRWGVPVQLLQRRTVTGRGGDLQDRATRAWNFSAAQYYKAEGIPWRPVTLEQDTCFVGIGFYVAQDVNDTLAIRSSVAQAFDFMGQGLVLRGDPFEWDEYSLGRTPHLTTGAARSLITATLREYIRVKRTPPKRVVIHKTSEFWGASHGQYNEVDGFFEGIDQVFPGSAVDLVSIRQTGVRLFREGTYPPLRGTYFCLEDDQHFLYTMGFIPYLGTYPGPYVPEPWQITDHRGDSSKRDLLAEVLALTKMNVNNCSFADGTPITLSFAQKIGDIMRNIPDDSKIQPEYRFYM